MVLEVKLCAQTGLFDLPPSVSENIDPMDAEPAMFRRGMDFRKTYFILPNLFTLANAFCGFYSIALSCGIVGENDNDEALYKAALAILVGLIFDGADGRIARLTKTQSELGLQLDSLADVITFGVAPALMIYRWGLEDFGSWGVFIAFIFVGCGALRLARFNVLATREQGKPGKYMIGLPIPIAANLLVALVMASHAIEIHRIASQTSIATLVVILGYLMISRVRFRSMKDLKLNRRTITIASAVVVFCLIVAVQISAPAVLLGLIALFIFMGLIEELLSYRRKLRKSPPEESEDREEDVLEELGIMEDSGVVGESKDRSDAIPKRREGDDIQPGT